MKKLLLATALLCSIAVPAFAGRTLDKAAPIEVDTNYPGVTVNKITLKPEAKVNDEGCRNYAISIFNKVHLQNINVSGAESTFGVVTVNNNGYVVTVYCSMDQKIVVIFVAGKLADEANSVLKTVYDAW